MPVKKIPKVPKKGKFFVVSAPSGSGKTTLCQKLIRRCSGKRRLVRSVSVTTRRRRKGEHQGQDYFFISEKEFIKRRKAHQFLEWARVLGNYYATPRDFVRKHINQGNDVLLSIDVQGAMQVKRMVPQAQRSCARTNNKPWGVEESIFVFILPPNFQELEKRLRRRSTESESEIGRRLKLARKEISFIKKYDYVVLNDKIKFALQRLQKIINFERKK